MEGLGLGQAMVDAGGGLRVQLQHVADPVFSALQSDRNRILDVFKQAISHSSPAASVALATMQEAMKPQKHAVLVQDENQLLENALRLLLQELVGAAVDAGEPVMQYGRSIDDSDNSGGLITRLLDIVLYLCEKTHVEGGMVFQLLEDLTEVSTIKDCKEVFAYIEGKQEVLGKTELFGRGKLVMLRTCNQLLRRLSKANDVVFCGRILMFLAHVFPLYERSAVNIKGVFNTSNETNYEKDQPDDVPIDFNFYKTFWGLQEHFSNPAALIPRWHIFSASLTIVLSAFDAQPLGDDDSTSHQLDEGDDMTFNTKYLTSCNLMSLELKDPSFRRHVLVQCLIVFDYLKTPGKTEKEAARESLKDEVKVLEDRVKRLLESTPPKGKDFLKSIEHLLEREKNWVWWKRDGCPPFEKNVSERKSSIEGTKKRKQRWRLGNKELSQLWKWADQNPNALTDPQRVKTPPVHEYWTALAEDMDPMSGIEAEYSHKNDKVYCWKGLRFSARQDLEGFARFTELGIEGVVPPELLTQEVRLKVHGKSDKSKQKAAKKGDDAATVPPSEENQNGSVAVDDGGAAQDVDDVIPMDSDVAGAKEEESQDDLERQGSDHEPLEGFPSTQDISPDPPAAMDNDSPGARSPGEGQRYFKKHSHPEGD
ncbi:THO complex subunit 1 [Selaginella moellendorffii]|uniref:THO complex subunit 1 n=1 Tax=Selaginella moellendorffii TaxID=88036 RepID=UPI000D1CEE18|nr:THO complex subunit 1 [Selaginella moellendorffii]XP_024521963.1 THO complex subunit 1 [Selaginella moellendorffii]|eukprot:XP_024521962.1 THO complex subunit 1 [Selaginella moellendorffii]